jgi:hypothetical protein
MLAPDAYTAVPWPGFAWPSRSQRCYCCCSRCCACGSLALEARLPSRLALPIPIRLGPSLALPGPPAVNVGAPPAPAAAPVARLPSRLALPTPIRFDLGLARPGYPQSALMLLPRCCRWLAEGPALPISVRLGSGLALPGPPALSVDAAAAAVATPIRLGPGLALPGSPTVAPAALCSRCSHGSALVCLYSP